MLQEYVINQKGNSFKTIPFFVPKSIKQVLCLAEHKFFEDYI